jgi:hypothetical protein
MAAQFERLADWAVLFDQLPEPIDLEFDEPGPLLDSTRQYRQSRGDR